MPRQVIPGHGSWQVRRITWHMKITHNLLWWGVQPNSALPTYGPNRLRCGKDAANRLIAVETATAGRKPMRQCFSTTEVKNAIERLTKVCASEGVSLKS